MSETLDIQTHNQKSEITGLSPEKEAFLKQQENFSTFSHIMKSTLISPEEKQKVLLILNNSDKIVLGDYFDYNGFHLIDEKGIKDFINNPEFISILKDLTAQEKDLTAQEKDLTAQEKDLTAQEKDLTAQQEKETAKNIFENSYSHIREKINKFKETFKEDREFLKILTELETSDKQENKLDKDFQDKHQKLIQQLATYLSKDNNATKIFQKLQNDPESYEALYKFLQNSGNSEITQVLKTIPPNPKALEISTQRAQKILDKSPYFPEINKDDIKTTGNIIQAQIDKGTFKIVDTQDIPPRSFISKYGYKIETQAVSQEILNIRAAFTKEKIKTQTQLNQNEKQILDYNKMIYGTDKENLQNELQSLEQKENKTFEDEIKINELKNELEKIKNIEENIKKLETQNEELKNEFSLKETEFLKYYSLSVGKQKASVQEKDQKARETLDFLNILGITNINQNDLQQIINRINIHPHAYGLSKPFDLSEGLSGTPTDVLKQKKEFFNLFSKIYEKAGFIPPPNESIIQGFTKDPRLSNETTFKQKLEDAGLTKGGGLQIESVMKVLGEKSEKIGA